MREQFELKFRQQMATTQRTALADLLRKNPRMSLVELGALVQSHPGLKDVTIGDLELEPSTGQPPPSAQPPAPVGRKPVILRTAADRMAYDRQVFLAVQAHGAWIGSEALGAHVEGTPQQLGAALRRLCGEERLQWSGVARGTKYRVAEAVVGGAT